ncbi:MAG: MBL fold metallo-hydrolase [Gemmatimonadaceae bacterium]|nr:MBL fold metallo-hydrolase [Acetobacteraceae bacterium]
MLISRRSLAGAGAALAVAPGLVGHSPAMAAQPPATAQGPAFFHYRVGDLQCTAINDGMAFRSLDGFVPNAPPGALQKAMADAFLPTDRYPIPFTTVVVNTGSKLVLIDTGNADLGAPATGTWLANFRAAGFDPANVDTVVISHFHGDHINGIRPKDGAARFPRAEVMVPAAEWAFWMSDENMEKAPAGMKPAFQNVRRVFGPIAANVTRYEWDKEIVPGITALDASGHTPGHTAFALSSGTGKLLVLSDTTNNPNIFARNPGWSAIFDQDGPKAVATRRRLLDMAATERMQAAFYHAPFPATGHIVREGDGYALVPLMWRPEV